MGTAGQPTPTRPAALVTGGSRGIGLEIARRLATEGWNLTLSARRPKTLETAAAELRKLGGQVLAAKADMASAEDIDALADTHLAGYGRTDLLLLSAGAGWLGDLVDFPSRRVDQQMAVNYTGPFRLMQRLLPSLRSTAQRWQQERGTMIVAIASMAGVVAEGDGAAYSASKAALIALCGSISVSEWINGVSATAVSPGYVDTDMTAWIREQVDPATMIRTADVAELVLALTRLSRHAVVANLVVSRPGPNLWRS